MSPGRRDAPETTLGLGRHAGNLQSKTLRLGASCTLAPVATMPLPLTALEVLNREFLEIRCKILDLAAALDRLDRAEGSVEDDPRMAALRSALAVLTEHEPERAERVQMIFSRPYDVAWQKTFDLAPR